MRFSVLEIRSDIRIALQDPVVKIGKEIRNKINIYNSEWGMEPPTTIEYEKNVYMIMKCSDNQCWMTNLDIYFS